MNEEAERSSGEFDFSKPVTKEIIDEYVREAKAVLEEFGYSDNKEFLRDVVFGFYARICANGKTLELFFGQMTQKKRL